MVLGYVFKVLIYFEWNGCILDFFKEWIFLKIKFRMKIEWRKIFLLLGI